MGLTKPTDFIFLKKKDPPSFEEIKENFIKGVFNDEYVLVVGSRVLLNPKLFKGTKGDINHYILKELNKVNNKSYKKQYRPKPYKTLTDIDIDTRGNENDRIVSFLNDGIKYNTSDISPQLLNLLKTRLFKIVLTTTFDGYLESLMEEIWGNKNFLVVNIRDYESIRLFNEELIRTKDNPRPTLFYLFGKVGNKTEKGESYVKNDIEAIKVIKEWIVSIDKTRIAVFLKQKRLLAIGCKFDDWYFRFFWYIITGISFAKERFYDTLAMEFKPKKDQQLKEYLQRRQVCIKEDDWVFLDEIYNILTSTDEKNPLRKLVMSHRMKGQIFISYNGNDRNIAIKLFLMLLNDRFNVWLDIFTPNSGDDHTEVIPEAINKAKIFLPILSPNVADNLKNKDSAIKTNYVKEWKMAASNKGLTVIPIEIGDYHFYQNKEIHNIFEQLIGRENLITCDMSSDFRGGKNNSVSYDNKVLSQVGQNESKKVLIGYAKLVESIKNKLKIPNDENN